ncbi:MAG: hypothetical protein KAR44_09175 [Candidatus Aegiribacteria sp.]|nr:hypothetical protein [Candidatus Aegiribacteria sp.]
MLKGLFPFLLFLLAGNTVADSSTMFVFPDGRGAMPIETDQITMEAESVSIVPTGNIISHTNVPEMEIICVFYLRNLTDQPLDVSVGFPFEDSVVSDWVQFRAFTGDEEFEITYESGLVNRDVFWPLIACWEMHFQPGETVRLVNTYNAGWNYFWYDNFTASFTYIVRSGALWAGRIGDAVISITVPEQYFSMLSDSVCAWADWNGSPEVDGTRITWHFTDWKPLEDITITSSGHHNVDDRIIEFSLYGYDCVSICETNLYSRWTPEELYPAALEVFGGSLPAETIARFLENTAYQMSGLDSPNAYLSRTLHLYMNDDHLPFDQEKLDIVMDLQEHLAEYRIYMESAGFDFLLPKTVLCRDWSDVNLEMYCSSPRDQSAYLLLLENIEDAVHGRPIVDPALESLFWLTGWFLPGEVSPMINSFTDNSTISGDERDTTIVSREEVRDFWMAGGGCDMPLVLSSSSESLGVTHITDLVIESSSEHAAAGDNNYSTGNLTDGDPETAWVEGVYGYGHGEVITVSTNEKIIAEGFAVRNGYCKPGGVWWENARIRKFIICLNNSPLLVAELFDTMDMQVIMFPEHLSLDPDDNLTFEILEIYPGATYQDAAVSELLLIMKQ